MRDSLVPPSDQPPLWLMVAGVLECPVEALQWPPVQPLLEAQVHEQ